MSPSGVNNAWREHAARHKRHWKDTDGSVTVGGTSTVMTATLNKGTTTLADIGPMILEFIASGSAPTLAVNGGTAKNLCWPDGTNIASGDIALGTRHMVLYDADKDKFVVMTPAAKAAPVTLTTRGDLLTMNSTPAHSRLAIGAASTVLRTDGSDPSWGKVAGAHIAMGSDAQGDVLYYNGTAYARLGAGTSGQFLKTQGAGANPTWANTTTLETAAATTSGSTAGFSGLPTGIKRIHLAFDGVSLSGTDNVLVQLSTGATFATSGYVSTCAAVASGGSTLTTSTAGIVIGTSNAADTITGVMTLMHMGSNLWVASFSGRKSTSILYVVGGDITLGGTLDGIRITRSGTDSFDAGSINILYD